MFAAYAAVPAGDDNQDRSSTKLDGRKFLGIVKEAGIDLTKFDSPVAGKNLADYLANDPDNGVIPQKTWEAIVKQMGFGALIKPEAFKYVGFDGKPAVASMLLKQLTDAARAALDRPTCTCSDAHALKDYVEKFGTQPFAA